MTTKTMYGSISEWDLGLSGMFFDSPESVAAAQKAALEDSGIEEPFEELQDDNLVGFETIEVPVDNVYGNLSALRVANRIRQDYWPGEDKVETLFRAVEFGGEAGELLDAVKKFTRAQKGIAGNTGQTMAVLTQSVMEEIGDVLISLDMLADDMGISLESCVPMKFNKTSRKVDIPVVMDEGTWETIVTLSDAEQMELFNANNNV